jgi:hypothetical protein
MSKFAEAVKAFEKVQERYMDFGAYDTEPSTEFQRLIRQLWRGEEPQIPQTADDWDLFSDKAGAKGAARALTSAAKKAIEAGKKDHVGLAKYEREELWRA